MGGGQDGGTAQGESELQDEGDPGRRLRGTSGRRAPCLLVAPSTGSRGRHRWVRLLLPVIGLGAGKVRGALLEDFCEWFSHLY